MSAIKTGRRWRSDDINSHSTDYFYHNGSSGDVNIIRQRGYDSLRVDGLCQEIQAVQIISAATDAGEW